MLGTALKQKGDLVAAVPVLQESIRQNPNDPGPYNTLAQILRQQGDLEGSKKLFAEGARAKASKDRESVELLQGKAMASAKTIQ